MVKEIALTIALVVVAPGAPVSLPQPVGQEGYNQRSSDVLPPPRFQHDSTARLATVNTQDAMNATCGKPERGTRLGCTRGSSLDPIVTMPNPCDFSEERYAHLLCHELAHVQGWGADHEP